MVICGWVAVRKLEPSLADCEQTHADAPTCSRRNVWEIQVEGTDMFRPEEVDFFVRLDKILRMLLIGKLFIL